MILTSFQQRNGELACLRYGLMLSTIAYLDWSVKMVRRK
jgi:hypothetical protein